MTGSFLIDTNIIIALFGGETSVSHQFDQAIEVFIPATALGELYFGARKSTRVEENINRIDAFASSTSILSCDAVTAREYGLIKHLLRTKGRPLPDNDIWIAALAKQYSLMLVSRDAHFSEIEDLMWVEW